MREITQREHAAMWLYHTEYAESALSAVEFYKRLSDYQKRTVDRMIADIVAYEYKPKRKAVIDQ